MHEIQQTGEKGHASCLVGGGHGHSHVRLHRVYSQKHLNVQKGQHEIKGGAGCSRQLSGGLEAANDGGHAEEVGGVAGLCVTLLQ